ISAATSGVCKIYHVAFGCQKVELVHKEVPILRYRTAMDFQDGWIFFLRIKSGGFQDPALQVVVISTFEPDFFQLTQIQFFEPILIDRTKLLEIRSKPHCTDKNQG